MINNIDDTKYFRNFRRDNPYNENKILSVLQKESYLTESEIKELSIYFLKGEDKVYGKEINERFHTLIDHKIVWSIPTKDKEIILLEQLYNLFTNNSDILR